MAAGLMLGRRWLAQVVNTHRPNLFSLLFLQGRSLDGPVYVAAKNAAHMQPLNPAAHNVLGLASGEPLLLSSAA